MGQDAAFELLRPIGLRLDLAFEAFGHARHLGQREVVLRDLRAKLLPGRLHERLRIGVFDPADEQPEKASEQPSDAPEHPFLLYAAGTLHPAWLTTLRSLFAARSATFAVCRLGCAYCRAEQVGRGRTAEGARRPPLRFKRTA
jgi:hypothetical protein